MGRYTANPLRDGQPPRLPGCMCGCLLTIIPVSSEELVEANKIGPASEIATFQYQNFFDQFKIIDDYARCRSKIYGKDVPVDFA